MSHFKGEEIEVALPNFQTKKSMLELLVEKMKDNGDETAMIEVATGLRASYADLLRYSMSFAAGLQKVGVTAGDLVVLCSHKITVLATSLLYAAMFTGATVVVIGPTWAETIKRLTLKKQAVKAIFYDTTCQDVIQETLSSLNSPPQLVSTIDWNSPQICDLKKTDDCNFSVYKVQDTRHHVPVFLTSSGTTGVPKIIEMTDFGFQYSIRVSLNTVNGVKLNLLYLPMAWVSSVTALMTSVIAKITLIIINSDEPKVILEHIEKYQIEMVLLGPNSLQLCAAESYNHQFNLNSIKFLTIMGDLLLASQAKTVLSSPFCNSRPTLCISYGSTETKTISTFSLTGLSTEFNTGCCGKLTPGVEVKILDEDNKILPIGELGKVAVKSPAMTPGYWDQPELNQQVFLEDGFFMTGDVGYMDTEGNLYVKGRPCYLINYKGYKFSPHEIEDILLSHPEVQGAVVVGKDHPLDIQHAKGFVVKVPGSTISQHSLQTFVNARVKESMRLRAGIHFIEEIPRAGTKIQRNVLQQL